MALENYEPIAWAEELIGPARAVDHPRLAALYVMAALSWTAGRIEAGVGYSEAGQPFSQRTQRAAFGFEGFLFCVYLDRRPDRGVELSRADWHAAPTPRHSPGQAWARTDGRRLPRRGEAAANCLIDAAEAKP